jgi:SAM-dependent methyltransferase
MSSGFDPYADRYEELVERSIGFSGQEQDFFLQAKARSLLDVVRRRLAHPGSVRALDVGCGGGLIDRHLGALGSLTGIDPSEPMIEAARTANPKVDYRVADGTQLPFEDGSFDLAFAVCVLHHVPPPDRPVFVAELARVTRPGGLAVVLEHNPLNPLTRLAVSRCEFDDDAILLGRRETRGRLRAVGLEPVEQRYIIFFPWRSAVLGRAERALAPVPLGAQYYVAAHA